MITKDIQVRVRVRPTLTLCRLFVCRCLLPPVNFFCVQFFCPVCKTNKSQQDKHGTICIQCHNNKHKNKHEGESLSHSAVIQSHLLPSTALLPAAASALPLLPPPLLVPTADPLPARSHHTDKVRNAVPRLARNTFTLPMPLSLTWCCF
jgi:hypothetical protein